MSAGEQPPCILICDDEPDITEGLARTLEQAGRKTILCSDVESAEIVLAQHRVTHLLCDVQFTGAFGFEGLHFLGRVRRLAPDCRIVLMTGQVTDALRDAAMGLGAAQLLAKPFDSPELERALGLAESRSDEPYEIARFPALEEILDGEDLWMAFQPVVRVTRSGVIPFGYEALLRTGTTWMNGGSGLLFEYAGKREHLAEVNTQTLRWGLEAAAILPSQATLFLNVDPVTFDDALPSILDAASRRAAVPLSRVVLEITERSAFPDTESTARLCDELRERGVRFAFDDHGSAYSHLSMIHRVRPAFIKISHSFGTAFECDATKERIIRHIVFLAYDFGCETILEGIESASTADALAGVGVGYAQGFHFGRPCPASHWHDPERVAI